MPPNMSIVISDILVRSITIESIVVFPPGPVDVIAQVPPLSLYRIISS